MPFINYLNALYIFMIMKFVQPSICSNDSNYYNLSYLKKLLILCHSFTKENMKENRGKDLAVQKKVLFVPNKFKIFLSVKIEMDPKEWNQLSTDRKRIVWSQSRSQLYWSCDNSVNSLSLCNSSGILTSSSLTIDIYDAFTLSHHLQCSVCFLMESNTEYLFHWSKVSSHIERVVFNLNHYLPQHLSNDHHAVQIHITRIDRISVLNEVSKLFITNISLSNYHQHEIVPNKCQFYCGWGPHCLVQIRDVCNRKMNCVYGEDEDSRLCKAIENNVISIKYDIQKTAGTSMITVSSTDINQSQTPVLSTIKAYIFVIICSGILLILVTFVGWFMCRNCEYVDIRYHSSKRKLNSTIVTPDSDTTCSTCEMKSKLNSSELSGRSRRSLPTQKNHFPIRSDSVDFQIPKYYRKDPRFSVISSNSHNFTEKESLRQLCQNVPLYSPKDRSSAQSSEWLNLFFHVSSEARHKSLLKQPPPNVNNNVSSDISNNQNIHKFSTAPLTCVFLVMI